MTKPIRFGPWTIQADVAATQRTYEQMALGGADECTCDPCQNFALVREQAYPSEVLASFEEFGIDYRKEIEVCHYNRLPSGVHFYGGWFYVVGSVAEGPEPWINGMQANFYRVSPAFEVGVYLTGREPSSAFSGLLPCVKIDFFVELPWRLDRPGAGLKGSLDMI